MRMKRNSTTGARLKYALQLKMITEHQLSLLSGVSDSIINRAIREESTLSEKNLIKITETLEVNPAWLLGYGTKDDIKPIWTTKLKINKKR